MKNSKVLWILALIITLVSAVYQRATGPTYPVDGESVINGHTVSFELARSHGGETDHIVSISTDSPTDIQATLSWKRYKTADAWTDIPMTLEENALSAALPHQPPAGKLMYKVTVSSGSETELLPGEDPIVIRFKGDVPAFVLIPHIFIMFASMFISARAGIEAILNRDNLKKLAYWSAGTLFIGGMILGPIVQKYAFGEFWTGIPWGWDLTDNKTLISMVTWIVAIIAMHRSKNARWWVLAGSVVQFLIYVIPHSVLGSELNYNEMDTNIK